MENNITMSATENKKPFKEKIVGVKQLKEKKVGVKQLKEKKVGAKQLKEKKVGAKQLKEKKVGVKQLKERKVGVKQLKERKVGVKQLKEKEVDKKQLKEKEVDKKQLKETKAPPSGSVVYVGHLPRGFYEEGIQKYFSQFGKIMRLHVARSRKTGGCKGFAFIQFECPEVAKVVADTMNNYLFFEKILKCNVVPDENIKPFMFDGWKKGHLLSSDVNREIQNKVKSYKQLQKKIESRLSRVKKIEKTLSNMGIKYNCIIKR